MMKTSLLAYIAALAGAIVLTSCITDAGMFGPRGGPDERDTGRPVDFNAGIDGSSPATRADTPATRTTNGGDDWVLGDYVGIYMVTTGGTVPANIAGGAVNARYEVADDETGELELSVGATAIQYPVSGTVDFVAYYPYEETDTGRLTTDGKFRVTLTDQTDQPGIDVLTARTPGIPYNTLDPIQLNFHHALSKITVNIRNGEKVTETQVADIEQGGVKLVWTPGSATIDINTGGVTPGANADIPLLKESPASGYQSSFTAIVAPSSGAGRHLSVAMGDKTVYWSIPMGDTFVPGHHYIYWGEISESNFSVNQSEVTNWVPDAKSTGLVEDKQNYRVTWDAASGRYVLTTDPTDAGLFFKFGSVVGTYSGPDGANHVMTANAGTDEFDPLDVAWSPLASDITVWTDIPVYDGTTDYLLVPNTVTAPLYHNKVNVKAGKGDPCRLVGLDLAKIRNAADADALTDADIDNGVWRLPTPAENKLFTGRDVNGPFSDHWVTTDGVNGAIFPDRDNGGANTFMPAAGRRDYNLAGQVAYQNTNGHFWTSVPDSATNASYMGFSDVLVYPINSGRYDYGFPIRCVRQ